ncbi:NAD(P)-binding protein [Xylariaceae sp. AK1471]|nr:NAD(P)-binding protein [Xylariaceae sp. AK1471]
MTTILITGATGLVGFRILLAALTAGYKVRYAVRSEKKAQVVSTNPAIQKLPIIDRDSLSSVIIPDFTVDGAFDSALRGITHIIHAGTPVPVPTHNPMTEVFEPTIKITSNLLTSALKRPSVRRVVITSTIVSNLPLGASPLAMNAVTASHRPPLPNPMPSTFNDVFEAYILGKLVQLHQSDDVVKTQPHFTVSNIMPGYVFGRNELMLDAIMMQTQNSSNNFLMMGMLGGELPFPIHGGFVHIDDLADVYLRVTFLDSEEPRDFGVATEVDYRTIFSYVEKAFPNAVAAGIFKRGQVPTLPVNYDSSDVEKMLGRLKSFEDAVVDVAGQYLEKVGVERA